MQSNIRHLIFILSFFLIISWSLSKQTLADSTDASGDNNTNEQSFRQLPDSTDTNSTVFSYQLEGRADPFAPFISEKPVSTINMDEIVENEETLTGMQLFEPGQLKLVAIVFENNAEIAMVEDAAGQGYALRPGMKIGKKGIITAITPNMVMIEETSVTRAGKKITTNIEMLLKKKGEE